MAKPIVLFLGLGLLTGCTEIIEKDLEGYGVVLLTPPAGHVTTLNQVVFRWETVPYATHYRVQVATPDLTAPSLFVLDSSTSSNTYTLTLSPGEYQWRVRAENGSSHTEWYTRTLTVSATTSLDGQVPVLVSPLNGVISDSNTIVFDWDTLPFTADHRFELRQNSETGALLQALITPESTITLNNLADGHYAWGVQAQNDVPSNSLFTYRLFTVDVNPPSTPVQLAPLSGATIPQTPFTFLWQSGQDAVTDTQDSLIVKNSVLQVIRSIGNVSGTYADSLGLGSYTWTVKTIDEAGNKSTAGPIAFTVQ